MAPVLRVSCGHEQTGSIARLRSSDADGMGLARPRSGARGDSVAAPQRRVAVTCFAAAAGARRRLDGGGGQIISAGDPAKQCGAAQGNPGA